MATSHAFQPEESLPHPPPNFPQPINTKQAVIYNKSGTKCMNIVKEPSGTPLSPTSPPSKDPGELAPSHSTQNSNGATKKKKKKKGKRKPPPDHIEDPDIANGTHNQHTKSHHNNYSSDFDGEEVVDVDIEDDEEFFSDDEGYDPEAPEIPFPRKDSITNFDDGIWNTNNNEERQRIREFWLQLGEEERRSLVKVEKEAVLKKMKEQQKHSCSCSVCGRKRTAIEEELETLYDAYYEELELYANQQQQFGSSPIEYRSEHGSDTRKELFNFGNSLTVKGGILTVADDLLKNDGKKFLEMMERLAERRMQREEEAANEQRDYEEDDDEYEDDYEEDGEEDTQTEEQRMEEGRRMFQIFAARMFEQRVLNAYREKVAQERQQKLLEELEEENRLKEERELKKLKEKERKKAKNRALKQQKEEERARKEAERLAEEQALRAEREKKAEEERKKREEERLRKEAERRAKEEERLKKEEEKRRRAKEEKEKEERRRKEQEAKERKEREEKERKDREEKARKEKEEKERRQRDERDKKEREAKERREREARERKEKEENERKERELKEQEKVRKEKEEKERREREEKERKDKEEKEQRSVTLPSTWQHVERKRTIPPIGQPSIQQSQPPINNQPAVQSKNVVTMSNGWINNYTSHESHQNIPPHHAINQPHHMPPPPNHPPHPIFSQNGPQPQFGGQPGGIINGPVGINNEIVNDVYTNNKKILNQPPPQPTNTLPGMNPASSLFTTGLGPIGMGVHPHHGGPPMPMHPHHPVMRQQIPPRGFNPIGAAPHLTGPATGVPPSVASTNLSLLNEPVISGNGNIGAAGLNTNPPPGAFGGLPLGGGQGPLGPQTFNLGTQVVGQPTSSSHIGPNVVQNAPLAPIGHRRMSQHPDDPHIKAVQRPQPIQRPTRRESVTTHTSLDTRTRSPPPGFGNMVGSGALIGDDQPHPMTNRRQSLAPAESSYFSNSLFSALPGETSQQSQSSQNQQPQPQHQLGSSRLTHRPVGDNEWPPIRRSGGTDNINIWNLNWYQEGNNNANRRVMGSSKDFGIP
ncbi:15855_t:CDS:10 [Dentiscutata erythropus]|uniref:Stress response protein NST1 n=1 Tax=Dentiscutata erythropus TaxID=1348616 RepID=A0A9N9FS31_9GLOM|nr:15855_t:CDS:10 [Dentiscutata erythropus]